MKTVNDASFQSDVIDASQSKPVVVCFAAQWSQLSQSGLANLEKMEPNYAGRATFVAVDVDESEDTATKYGISVMPAFMVFTNSQPQDEWSGNHADKIREKLDRLIPQ